MPDFYIIVTLGFTGIYLLFLVFVEAVLTTHNQCFKQKINWMFPMEFIISQLKKNATLSAKETRKKERNETRFLESSDMGNG